MFGEIVSITKNYALVKVSNTAGYDLLNFNVILEENNIKVLGEIEEIVDGKAKVNFLGEFVNNTYFNGIIRRPTFNATIRMINNIELGELVNFGDEKAMVIGNSPLYNNCVIKANINDLFSNHIAIFGNTGSGKTCGVASLIQNFFKFNKKIPSNSNIVIFNNTSEYDNAFKDINKINSNFHYKLFSTNNEYSKGYEIKIPLWLMSVDDYANLLDVTEYMQINIIERMLNLVSIFARNDESSNRYKNHLIAKAIISVLYSNQVSARIRDQIFEILQECNTSELNLNVEVPGIGYKRELRKCFDIDSKGEFVERILIVNYIKSFINDEKKWKEDFISTYFNLDLLETALKFVLISDGYLLNEKAYGSAMALKVKLHTINNSFKRKYFEVDNYINLNNYIFSLFLNKDNKKVQLLNFVLDDVDDKFAKSIIKILTRIMFNYSKSLYGYDEKPFFILYEEAHRYIQNDRDKELLGYNIFERIAKEGRKFGFIINLISQRPTELSETVLSQCSNFLIFKLNHPSDLEYIRKMVPNISSDVIEKQKSLQAGNCVAFGRFMKIPLIIKLPMPNPEPNSSNISIYDNWMDN